MMDENSLAELTREIMAQGYDEATAGHYSALIGDVPFTDAHGNIVVLDENRRELARLRPLKMFHE
jgi:ribulose-5-phosphate 4-epimerase/fuculose-1-phosphate aldolase